MQVHKSYIVNIGHINTIEGHTLHLGSKKITMGANYTEALLKHVLKDRFIKR
jgi:DNA-binding LytR/AlgR family response regulator